MVSIRVTGRTGRANHQGQHLGTEAVKWGKAEADAQKALVRAFEM